MRRKCFIAFIVLLSVVLFLNAIGARLIPGEKKYEVLDGATHEYDGVIRAVEVRNETLKLRVKLTKIDGKKVSLPGTVLVSVGFSSDTGNPYDLIYGAINFRVVLEKAQGQRNPNCFDYRTSLKSKKVFLVGDLKSYDIFKKKVGPIRGFARFLLRKRYEFKETLPEGAKGITSGLLFGDTTELDEDIYDDFQRNGVCHVLAVSGLHIGLLYKILRKLFGEKDSKFTLILLSFAMISYGIVSLFSASVLRAELMIGLSLVAKRFDLRYDSLTALSAVGIGMILLNPYAVLGTGFQLSFLAIGSIIFFSPILPKVIPELVKATVAVTFGMMLYQVYLFNYISLMAIVVNIVVVTLVELVLPAMLAYFGAFLIFGELGFMSFVLAALSRAVIMANELSSFDGMGSITVLSPAFFVCFFLTVAMCYLASEHFYILRHRKNKRRILIDCAIISLATIIVAAFTLSPVSYDDIVFVDVGQGDCTRISVGTRDILIDGGGTEWYNVGKKTLRPYLLKNGAKNIDLVLMTHLHTDHYRGIEELVESFPVKRIEIGATAGRTFRVDPEVYIEAIWPLTYDQEDAEKDENANCSVYIIHYKGYKIMVTGDLDSEGEQNIINYYAGKKDLHCDILKIGHHGSKTSSSEEFLRAVCPKYAVIQVGKNNYGHPTKEVLDRLFGLGITVLRNDKNGAVGFRFKKNKIVVHKMIEW